MKIRFLRAGKTTASVPIENEQTIIVEPAVFIPVNLSSETGIRSVSMILVSRQQGMQIKPLIYRGEPRAGNERCMVNRGPQSDVGLKAGSVAWNC